MLDITITSKYGNTAITFPHTGECAEDVSRRHWTQAAKGVQDFPIHVLDIASHKGQPSLWRVSPGRRLVPLIVWTAWNHMLTFSTGYFGVTPVRLAGAVHVRLQGGMSDLPLRSVQLQVRCSEQLESGGLRNGKKEHVLWQAHHDLWKPPVAEEATMPDGVLDLPFKLRIPLEVADQAAGSKSFREWRVKWRLVAIVNHKPIPHVGNRLTRAYPINIRDYRSPPPRSPSEPGTSSQVVLSSPTSACGPLDVIPLSVSFRPDPSTTIRKASVVLERRVECMETSPRRDDGVPPKKSSRLSSMFTRSGLPDERGKSITTPIVETPIDVSSPDECGVSRGVGAMTLTQRTGRWDIGATETTDLVDVSFALRVKYTVKVRNSTKEVVSEPVPVTIIAATAGERAEAHKAAEPSSVPVSATASASDILEPKHTLGSSSSPSPSIYLHCGSQTDLDNVSRWSFVPEDDGSKSTRLSSQATSRASSAAPSPVSSQAHLPSVQTLLRFSSPTPAPSMGADSPRSETVWSPCDDERLLPTTSRRRSSGSTSDEEDLPHRSRMKLWKPTSPPFGLPVENATPKQRPTRLPSLDALGLGLPHVPTRAVRPSTAPHPLSVGVYSAKPSDTQSRPQTSAGPNPPRHEGTFAFSMPPFERNS